MYVVGLTGGIGSGKSTVAGEFSRLGVRIIDADQIARQAVAPGTEALARIARRFGAGILTAGGTLERKALREIVFTNQSHRHWLESLLHPRIAEFIRQDITNCQQDYCLLESPLLLETSQAGMVHRILVVDVDESTQRKRAADRDHSSVALIQSIMQSQTDRQQRLAAADDILDNELPMASLAPRVQALHEQYLLKARRHATPDPTRPGP